MATTRESTDSDSLVQPTAGQIFFAAPTGGDTPVIELRGAEKVFGYDDTATTALDGVDLVIERGEFVAIMGPSGCGKTTLLNVVGLLDRPTSGDYLLNGRNVAKLSASRKARIRNREVGFVFQNFNLIQKLNVLDNVTLPLTYQRGLNFRHQQKVSTLLKTFGLQNREYYMPYQLSGGQTQRVAIARALVNKPSIILADEPTGNLDSKNTEIIMDELTRIHREDNTILMVTHNPDLLSYASRVIHMKDGKIVRDIELTKNKAHATATKFVSRRKAVRGHRRSIRRLAGRSKK
ncbi:ABC transporter ATP-binding protein [Candidatus Saccharibacteria bacterium]|nr:ABC transporter ATP-binding protein [Candidatus Saccharibacteria bacterium]